MYFVPVQSEKISSQGGQTHQGTSAGVDNSGLFGSLLAGQLSGTGKTANAKSHWQSFGDLQQADQQLAVDELVQLLDLEQLNGGSKQQLMDLVQRVIQLLQNDPRGKQLIEALNDGEFSLVLPLEFSKSQDKQSNQNNLAFLVIQQGKQLSEDVTESSIETNSEISAKTDESVVNFLLDSLQLNLILNNSSGGEKLGTNLNVTPAGTLQLTGDQVMFHSEKSDTENIPVILMRSVRQQDNAGAAGAATGPEQKVSNIPLNSLLMLSTEKNISEMTIQNGGTQAAKSAASIIQSVQTMDKAAAGEIAALLKSLQGQIQVRKTRRNNQPVEHTASLIQRLSTERQHQHIAQKVAQTQAKQSEHSTNNYAANQSGTQQKTTGNDQLLFQNLTNQNTAIEFGDELQAFASGDIFSMGDASAKAVSGAQLAGKARPVLAQVIQKIDAMVQAVKTHQSMTQPQILNARLALEPKHLGSLVMQLKYQGDTLSGTILAASREAKNIIEQSLPMLKDALLNHHTHLQDVKVEIQQNFTSDQSADSFQHQFAGQSGQDADSDVPFEEFDLDAILQETGEAVSFHEDDSMVSNSRDGWYA